MRERVFGEKAAFIRALPCVVGSCAFQSAAPHWSGNLAYTIAAHVKSRGAGGTSKDLVPMCNGHHTEQHSLGIKTFAAKYGLDLEALAELYEAKYESTIVEAA